jgi:L-lactate dehydrogenase complex protein LldE
MNRLSLFIPCLMDVIFPETAENALSLLRRLGCDPVYPEGQTCCGLMPFNAGHRKAAKRLARHFIEVFEQTEVVVCPSGSCVNMVRNRYPELFCDEPHWLRRAESISGKTFELSEYLVDVLGAEGVGAAYEGKVAYHESCNLVYGLGVTEQPKRLIRAVKGTELVPMDRADICCGFGGEFSHNYSQISEAMVADKVDAYIESGADLLVTGEPGCLLNIGGYLSRHHPHKRAVHLADFLMSGQAGSSHEA